MGAEGNYIFVANPPVGRKPQPLTCPNCHDPIVSVINEIPSAKTHILCMCLSLLGCFLCAPCIYLNKDCLAKEHYCPKCDTYLGTYDG